MRYQCNRIEWDTDTDEDCPAPDLPAELIVEADTEEEIADKLSDATGFCVLSFFYLPLTKETE